jgi:peptidoglycan/LPS O-acetylase OafA/YrhL
MDGRRYPWIIFVAGITSAACLVTSYARYHDLAAARDWNIGSAGFLLALVPGAFCVVVWIFQRRHWLRRAGLMASLGVLAYSIYSLLRALVTDRLGGDMGFMVEFQSIFDVVLTLGWSVLALASSWLGGRDERDSELVRRLQPDTPLERTSGE